MSSLGLKIESDLTTTILRLTRSVNLGIPLKYSCAMEIDLELDLDAARVQRQKEMISKLCKKDW